MAALELAVPKAEPVELLAVRLIQLGELALQLARLEEAGLELGDRLAERVRESGEPRRASQRRKISTMVLSSRMR